MATRLRRACWAIMIVAALVACRQIVGIGDEPPGAGSEVDAGAEASVEAAGTCGGFPWGAGSCASCMESSCCAEATACQGDAVCAKAFACAAACAPGDEVCRGACVTAWDDVMAPLGACQATSCAAECGLECGGWGLYVGPYLPQARSASCQSCIDSPALCPSLTACGGDPACLGNRFCVNGCLAFDGTCVANCNVTHPLLGDAGADGGNPLAGFGSGSFYTTCYSACQLGTDWSCVGSVAWPSSTSATISYNFEVIDFPDGNPVAGAIAYVCDKGDATCASPASTATTDSAGMAALTIQVQPYAFDGYIEVVPTVSSGYATTLSFSYPYLTESNLPPSAGSGIATGLITVLPSSLLPSFAAAAGSTYDPTLGTIFSQPLDCEGIVAAGVSFVGSPLGPSATSYYMVDDTPNGTVTATQFGNLIGGGFLDVAPGLVTFSGTVGGKTVATAVLQVRAGAVTIADLVPRP